MRRSTPALLITAAILGLSGGASAGDKARLVFMGATIVRVEKGDAIGSATVVVEGTKITAVTDDDAYKAQPGDRVVDCHRKFLIPGLADMHVHLDDPLDLPVFVAHGITTVREMASSSRAFALRREIQQGKLLGPSMIVASPRIDGGASRLAGHPGFLAKDDPQRAREFVRQFHREGYDGIKVGWQLPKKSYFAVLDEAAKLRIAVWGPVPAGVSLEAAMRQGHRSVEHMLGWESALIGNDSPLRELPQMLLRNKFGSVAQLDAISPLTGVASRFGVFHTPTFVQWRALGLGARGMAAIQLGFVSRIKESIWRQAQHAHWHPGEWRRQWLATEQKSRDVLRRVVRQLERQGAPVLAGTGYGFPFIVPGVSLHDELAELVDAGLEPEEALKASTSAAARLMGKPKSFGQIIPGARADLVVLNANPLDDIGAVRRINAVVIRGKLLSRERINTELARVRQLQADYEPFRGIPPLPEWKDPLWQAEFLYSRSKSDDRFRAVVGGERFVVARVNGRIRGVVQIVAPSVLLHEIQVTLTDTWELDTLVESFQSDWRRSEVRGKRVEARFEFSIKHENEAPESYQFPMDEGTTIGFGSILSYVCDIHRFRNRLGKRKQVELVGPFLGIDDQGHFGIKKRRVAYRRVPAPRFELVSGLSSAISVSFPDRPKVLEERTLLALGADGWPIYFGVSCADSEFYGRYETELRKR